MTCRKLCPDCRIETRHEQTSIPVPMSRQEAERMMNKGTTPPTPETLYRCKRCHQLNLPGPRPPWSREGYWTDKQAEDEAYAIPWGEEWRKWYGITTEQADEPREEHIRAAHGIPAGSKYVKRLCPYHDDHEPSLVIWPGINRYRCYACGKAGRASKLKPLIK